jgi:hypothetical protein
MRSILVMLLITSTSMAQKPNKSDFLEDLAYLKTTLPKKHINLFSKISEKDFNAKVEAIEKNADSLNYETFVAELLKLIVAIGDEHTFVEMNYPKVLPIKFEWFKEGIYITGVDAKYAYVMLGKLTAINGISIDEISNRFKAVILNENKSYFEVGLLNYINNPSFLKGLKIINNNEEATYTLTAVDGKETTITLKSLLKKENNNMTLSESYFSLLATKSNDFYWYNLDEKNNLLYVNYSKCREMEQKPFEQFNNELFSLIENKKPTKSY